MAGNSQVETSDVPERTSGLSDDLYASLRNLAHFHLRSQKGDITLNCTALVHEAYLKLVDSRTPIPKGTSSYSALASLAMRQILVDYVRKKRSGKHGGDLLKVTLGDPKGNLDTPNFDLLDIDRAMKNLASKDPYLEELVALRFFAGMSTSEAASALERSGRSVERDWARARTYLVRALEDHDEQGE